jgi:hypothetical protein
MKYLIVFSLFTMILVSGCVIPILDNTYEQKSSGLNIIDLEPDFSEVRSGEVATFRLRVRNTGTSIVENGFAELLGADYTWKGAEGTDVIGGEVLPDEENCKYTKKSMVLLPESPGVQAGEAICTWRYIAPYVQKGLYVKYKPKVRVYYNYDSFVQKSITIASKNELKMIQDQGKSLPSGTTEKSNAPVELDLTVNTPIRVYADSVEFPVTISVKNVGGGIICRDSASCKEPEREKGWNMLMLKIETPTGISLKDCDEYDNKESLLYIVQGSYQNLACKMIVDEVPDNLLQRTIVITAKYGYFVEKETSIEVIG